MRVKIGNVIYDSNDEIICLELSGDEKDLISNMGEQKKFCSIPESIDMDCDDNVNMITEFMKF